MKKPLLDSLERMIVRHDPDSYTAARYRVMVAYNNLRRDLINERWWINKMIATFIISRIKFPLRYKNN